MTTDVNTGLSAYNDFCKSVSEGNILYNLDSTNGWGEYLMVTSKMTVKTCNIVTYTLLLIGLKKEKEKMLPTNQCIKLTPDYAGNIPFLKPVGYCKFRLIPDISSVNLNLGMAAIYGSVDLWKYKEKLSIRKPKARKYGKDGKPIIKKIGND